MPSPRPQGIRNNLFFGGKVTASGKKDKPQPGRNLSHSPVSRLPDDAEKGRCGDTHHNSAMRCVGNYLYALVFGQDESDNLDNFIENDDTLRRSGAQLVRPWWVVLLLEIVAFFRRRRVYLGLFVVVLAVVLSSQAQEVFESVTSPFIVAEPNRPGLTFLDRFNGGRAELPRKHPVIIIPGFVTSAMDLWEAKQTCLDRQPSFSHSIFRQRMFGPSMLFLILTDPACWLDLFSMDKTTGLDKKGIKVRPDSGLASVDYFVPGYWVWAKVIINLADIGYDPQDIMVMTYDWRLSPQKAHDRDGIFHNIRSSIMLQYQKFQQRLVVISHSYGALVALDFFKWAEMQEKGFMNKYVAYYINVGGTVLGLPKAASALLQGDVKDTLTMPRSARRVLDTFVTQGARYNCTRTWSCLINMLPHGCEEENPHLWTFSNGTALGMRELAEIVIQECERSGHTDCARQMRRYYEILDELPVLPPAPNTTVVCLYGVNKTTEVGYRIEDTRGSNGIWNTNMDYNDANTSQGVHLGNGDGTVPLLSLGYMCRAPNGWQQNVGRVVTVEYPHDEQNRVLSLRGGSVSGDHVDILGNYGFIETILKVVSGLDAVSQGGEGDTPSNVDPATNHTETTRLKDTIFSNIDTIIQQNRRCLAKPNRPIVSNSSGSQTSVSL
ncbi:unnamed protein product [Phytomonas sp. EM1]|nr:unnamed protein product [Phytomonas sp. EM1]|eukprot:CCW64584.1 unnamed protein product [Phytomonas sp. isolate EM1]